MLVRPITDVLLLLVLQASFGCHNVVAQTNQTTQIGNFTLTTTPTAIGDAGTEIQQQESMTRRTFITVEYDYRLEVNTTANSSSNAFGDVQGDIDSNVLTFLQERLPNGDIPEGKQMPDIQFSTINSRYINMCYTESDICKFVKSRIRVSYAGVKPEHSVERVTLALVQEYLQDINDLDPMVDTMYAYPMYFSTVGQFQLLPVKGPMSDTDIEFFEETFYEVFNAISFSLDGDTVVTDAHYVYQSLTDMPPDLGGDGSISMTYSLSTDLKYFGKCRYCDKEQFVNIVDGLIEDNLGALLKSLKRGFSSNYNNITYFIDVEDISYALPELPEGLPPIEDPSIFDRLAPTRSNPLPWYLYFGTIIAVCLLITGVLVVVRDQQQLSKEENSTDGESSEDIDTDDVDDAIEETSTMEEDTVVSKKLLTRMGCIAIMKSMFIKKPGDCVMDGNNNAERR